MTLPYVLHVLGLVFISTGLLVGQQLLLFDAGILCLCTAAYFAIGAYASSSLSLFLGWGILPALVGGSLIAGLFAAATGGLLLKTLRSDFLALATLGVAQATHVALIGVGPGRAAGLAGIPRFSAVGDGSLGPWVSLLPCLVLAGVCLALGKAVRRSRYGVLLNACRVDRTALEALGFRPYLLQVQMWLLAGWMAGASGALQAHYLGVVEPGMSAIPQTVLVLCGAVLAGRRWLMGSVFGAGFLVVVPQLLERSIFLFWDGDWRLFHVVHAVFGVLIIAIVLYRFLPRRSPLRTSGTAGNA